jgi:hypothetical protein
MWSLSVQFSVPLITTVRETKNPVSLDVRYNALLQFMVVVTEIDDNVKKKVINLFF